MAEDHPISITSSHRIRPDEVSRHVFGQVRRGLDPSEVQRFLEDVARDYAAVLESEAQLRQALRDAEHRAANPVLDERTLNAALGQETARILNSAHDAAGGVAARAETDARAIREDAEQYAATTRASAEREALERTNRADSEAAEVRARIEEEARLRLDASRAEASAMVAQARAECRSMVQQAQQLRTRVLTDLTQRRRVLHTQIEQLRAGRERLAETIHEVRHAVDRLSDDLFRAEDDARSAAETAGQAATAEAAGWSDDDIVAAVTQLDTEPSPTEPATLETAPDGDPEHEQAVEDLFARLRATQSEPAPTDPDPVVAAQPADTAEPVAAEPATTAEPVAAEPVAPEPVAAPEYVMATQQTPPPVVATAQADEPEDEPGTEPEASAPIDPELARRDEALGPLMAALSRKLKRALQDDQNDILDRLRNAGRWANDLLPPIGDQVYRYAQASTETLADAHRQGCAFAADNGGASATATTTDAATRGADEEAATLAASIVGPLRRRLEEHGAQVDADDESAMTEHVGAAYREWKGKRVERLAGDHLTAIFSKAVVAATPEGGGLRWVVDDDGRECADCDDNSLAEPVKVGEPFPTGHAHPPAHPGCRCLVVVTDSEGVAP